MSFAYSLANDGDKINYLETYMFKRILSLMIFVTLIFITSCKTTEVTQSKKQEFTVDFAQKLQDVLQNGTIEEALALFETMPEKYQNDYSMNLLHASLLVSARNLEKATEIANKLDVIDPENIDTLVVKSMIAKASGDKKAKSEILKQIIAKDPTNADANVELANEQMLRKNYKLANTYYGKSLQSDPNHEQALFGYGQSAYYNDDLKKARTSFEKLVEVNPNNALGWAYLGKLAGEDENYAVATKHIEKAISLDSNYYDFWVDYGQYLYYQGKFADAEKAWTKAISIDDQNFYAYIYRAALYDENGRFAEALADYKKIVEVKPEYYYAYESIGMLAWHEKKYTEARNAFLQAYKYNKDNISYPMMVSATYLKEKKETENRKFLVNVLKNRDIKTATYSVIRLYYDGVNPSAVATRVKNEQNLNSRGKLLYYLALYHEIRGDDQNAKKYYNDIIKLQAPMFFEYRLAEWALQDLEKGL